MARKQRILINGSNPGALATAYYTARKGFVTKVIAEEQKSLPFYTLLNPSVLGECFSDFLEVFQGYGKVVEKRTFMLSKGTGTCITHRLNGVQEGSEEVLVVSTQDLLEWLGQKASQAGAEWLEDTKIQSFHYDSAKSAVVSKLSDDSSLRSNALVLGDGSSSGLIADPGESDAPSRSVYRMSKKFSFAPEKLAQHFGLEEKQALYASFIGELGCSYPCAAWLFGHKNNLCLDVCFIAPPYLEEDPEVILADVVQTIQSHSLLKLFFTEVEAEKTQFTKKTLAGYKYLAPLFGDGWLRVGQETNLYNPLRQEVIQTELVCSSFAADALERSLNAQDTSARSLGVYHQMIHDSYIIQNLKTQKNSIEEMEKDPSLLSFYGNFINQWFENDQILATDSRKDRNKAFFEDSRNQRPVWEFIMGARKSFKILKN